MKEHSSSSPSDDDDESRLIAPFKVLPSLGLFQGLFFFADRTGLLEELSSWTGRKEELP